MPRYKLRTLLIVLALGPLIIGWYLSPPTTYELVERLLCRLAMVYVLGIVAFVFWDWRRKLPPHHC